VALHVELVTVSDPAADWALWGPDLPPGAGHGVPRNVLAGGSAEPPGVRVAGCERGANRGRAAPVGLVLVGVLAAGCSDDGDEAGVEGAGAGRAGVSDGAIVEARERHAARDAAGRGSAP
jgi:hypothetical protein